MENYALKCKVNIMYDLQRLRLQTNGRINNEHAQVVLGDKDKEFLTFLGDSLSQLEKQANKNITAIMQSHPVWIKFLSKITGLREQSASVLLSSIDIHKAATPSALWMYCGLGVVPKVMCSKCGHVGWHNKGICQKVVKSSKTTVGAKKIKICGAPVSPVEGERGRQRPVEGELISYNKWLRTKLLGVIGTNFIRCNSEYRIYYDNYKNRLINEKWGKSDGHRHHAAIRYMMKRFLIDLYTVWRGCEGLSVRPEYAVEYLGKHKDHLEESILNKILEKPDK